MNKLQISHGNLTAEVTPHTEEESDPWKMAERLLVGADSEIQQFIETKAREDERNDFERLQQGYRERLEEFFWAGYNAAQLERDMEVDTEAVLEDLYKKIKEGRQ